MWLLSSWFLSHQDETVLRLEEEEEEEGALWFDEKKKKKKEKCFDFHRMACRLSNSLLENVIRGLSHAGAFRCRQYQNNMTTAKIKSRSESCFHVKCSILGSEAWYCHHLSLHCCVLFTLFCLSWAGWEAAHLFASFYYISVIALRPLR